MHLSLKSSSCSALARTLAALFDALSFGNAAQLYSDSPRIALFDNVGIDVAEMKEKPVKIDQERLKKLQDEQIEFLSSVLK